MDSNAKRIGSVQIPGGKMIAFQSAENDPYPGIEIMLVTKNGTSILSRTECDAETGELKVIAYSPSSNIDTPISITRITADGDWCCEDSGI